jgi:hypothetical protein
VASDEEFERGLRGDSAAPLARTCHPILRNGCSSETLLVRLL